MPTSAVLGDRQGEQQHPAAPSSTQPSARAAAPALIAIIDPEHLDLLWISTQHSSALCHTH